MNEKGRKKCLNTFTIQNLVVMMLRIKKKLYSIVNILIEMMVLDFKNSFKNMISYNYQIFQLNCITSHVCINDQIYSLAYIYKLCHKVKLFKKI